MLVQRYDDIRPGLKQVDRLDEATHDIHHEFTV
jgi:hypothetical protein